MDLCLITLFLFGLAAVIFTAAGHAVLTNPLFTEENKAKLKLFVIISSLQFFLAGCTLTNDAMARSGEDPTNIFPIEHVNSWQRVGLFGACAVLSVLVTTAIIKIGWLSAKLPSLKAIFPIAILGFAAGLLFSHSLDRLGFCCETPYTFFFGYPFSALQGVNGYDYSIRAFADYGLLDILSQSTVQVNWSIRFYPLLLDALFWLNSSFVLCSVGTWFIPARKQAPEMAVE